MSDGQDTFWKPLEGEIMIHPEVELRMIGNNAIYKQRLHFSRPTVMDILEIFPDRTPVLHSNVGAIDFVQYLKSSEKLAQKPSLRVIFLDYFNPMALYSHLLGQSSDRFPDGTARLMHQQYGIPLMFFRCLCREGVVNYAEAARSSFVRKTEDGTKISLDGMYQSQFVSTRYSVNSCHVWFSQPLGSDSTSRTSNYVIHGNDPRLKRYIFACAKSGKSQFLLRPFTIDTFIHDLCLESIMLEVGMAANRLSNHEARYTEGYTNLATYEMDDITELLKLSQLTRIIWPSLDMCKHTVTYLMATIESHRDQCVHEDLQTTYESLDLVIERVKDVASYFKSFDARIRIQMDISYNHASRQDNKVNLRIAQLTSKIAVAAQQDSSAMITMAAMTMFFLPGTFVSALFSMVFFTRSPSDGGAGALILSSQWWIYVAVTIPLTALVFLTWHMWRRRRTARAMSALEGHPSNTVKSAEKTIDLSNSLSHALRDRQKTAL